MNTDVCKAITALITFFPNGSYVIMCNLRFKWKNSVCSFKSEFVTVWCIKQKNVSERQMGVYGTQYPKTALYHTFSERVKEKKKILPEGGKGEQLTLNMWWEH